MPHAEVRLAWKTQPGHRHQVEGLENEDAVFVTDQHPLFDALLLVADGMGGHPRPREAAQTAVRAAREFLFDARRLEQAGNPGKALGAAVRHAHEAVRGLREAAVRERPGGAPARPPGTTLSIAVVVDGALLIAHVGDGSVFLVRAGRSQTLAGGEERRVGNRPAQYLGQDLPLEPEQRQLPCTEGDRVLLCTDGLTRYFREAGPEALERVVGRSTVELQAVANQLTAHSRPDEYDDDTTVALVEIAALHAGERPRPRPRNTAAAPTAPLEPAQPPLGKEKEMPEPTQRRGAASAALLGAVVGAALLAGGFLAGRLTAAPAGKPSAGPATPEPLRQPAGPAALKNLPKGNLILLDELGSRVYVLATDGGAPGAEPVDLRAFKVGKNGRLAEEGRFRLDPVKGQLTDGDGHTYPVTLDSTGAVRVLRGGALRVETSPTGARVSLDGRAMGKSPLRLSVPAGPHRVRVEGDGWARESDVEIPAEGGITLRLTAP